MPAFPRRRRLTCEHLAEISGVHGHDDVGFGRWLALPRVARATLQVQEPNAPVFTLDGHKTVT